jgi:hypothetical protein
VDDIRRTFKELHWGTRYVRSRDGRVEAQAQMPDERVVDVLAWAESAEGGHEGPVAVQVRVGRFGDAEAEAAFLAALKRTLDGEPARKRVQKFILPEW